MKMPWIWDGKYPVRARIVDAAGTVIVPGFVATTPDVSRSHIGKEGLAEWENPSTVKITLDDGSVLYGYECWWEPVEPK